MKTRIMLYGLIILLSAVYGCGDVTTKAPGKHKTRVYYIDFEKGNDENPGTAKDAPWQHHPWDVNAAGKAAAAKGTARYVFKKGVIYRGTLVARDSGEPGNPIILGVDPAWGEGEALIFGSKRISGGWKRATSEDREIPAESRRKVWYRDLDIDFIPMMAYELGEKNIVKLNIARSPNWEITNPDDPREGWWELTEGIKELKVTLPDVKGFKVGDEVYATGKWVDREEDRLNIEKGLNKVTGIGTDWITINVIKMKKGEFVSGAKISNGKVTYVIKKVEYTTFKTLEDKVNLTQKSADYWKNGVIWCEEDIGVFPRVGIIKGYDPGKNRLYVDFFTDRARDVAAKYSRYFIEDLPQLLDSENEWYYTKEGKHKGRIYVRLENDRDPNNSIIEIARYPTFLKIAGRKHIVVRDLSLKFFNGANTREIYKVYNPMYYSSVFRITGNSGDISILNCNVEYSSQGVSFFPDGSEQTLDGIKVNGNRIENMENNAVNCSLTEQMWLLRKRKIIEPVRQSRIKHIQVKDNVIRNTGLREQNWNAMGAIGLRSVEMVEVSNNVVDYTGGQGIIVRGGDYYEQRWHHYRMDYPLNRIFIFGNRVSNTMLALQDYGGISFWYGGPAYIYNNISGNAVGLKRAEKMRFPNKKNWYRTGSYAPAIYLDQGYKSYVFNNILWGKNNDENDFIYNSVAFNEAEGFMNVVFNNTMYNCAIGLHKGMFMHNRNYYLNNLFIDMGERYISQEVGKNNIQYDSLAYAANVFNRQGGKVFSRLGPADLPSLSSWVDYLKERKVMVASTGTETDKPQVVNAGEHDFRLRKNSIAIDRARKVFVPWGLYEVVGEWGFYKHPADITRILDEHINWNKDWTTRAKVRGGSAPRRDLKAHGIGEGNFKEGILENWVEGALELNGKDQYCLVESEKSGLLDMDTNNFLIEAVLLIKNNETDGGIVDKSDSDNGYSLLLEKGRLKMTLKNNGEVKYWRESKQVINDGKWHHVIVEADRKEKEGINIYIDGKLSNGRFSGEMDNGSLSNNGDFLVGKTATGRYLSVTFDFLRVSRGTLKQAETDIEELYDWEFNGPFLKDFYGRLPQGKARDAGAVEYREEGQE